MSIRVHELAKRCGLTSKEMIAKLHEMNYPVKTPSSTVDKITAEAIEKEYGYVPPPPAPAPEPPVVSAPPAPPPEQAPAIAEKEASEAAVATMTGPPAVVEPPATVVETARPALAKVAPPTPPPPAPAVAAPKTPALAPAPAQAPRAAPTPQPTVRITTAPRAVPAAPVPRPTTPVPAVVASAAPAFVVDDKGNKVIQMKPPVIVRDFAQRIGVRPHVLLKELMELGVFANLTEQIGEDIARKVCERHGFLFELEKRERGAGIVHAPPKKVEPLEVGEKASDLKPRPPVVTVMGHVDHGKTSLLDAIRKTDVVAHESGGITQHIGASVVSLPEGKTITFLDTPGHQAFTKMRARGANVTDIAILVVAADDGIMPQTIEAINHAKSAQVPIIVAINKCDLPTANPDRVKKQLQEQGLSPESWGGETITVEVSATTKKGLDTLLEMILLQAEIMELKASPKVPAKGNVIEAQVEPGMGPTATVLVRKGVLRVGAGIVCGPHWAKIRALISDKGQRVKEAGPSTPVKIVGLSGLPEAGAEFHVMESDKEARALAEQRTLEARAAITGEARGSRLEDLFTQLKEGEKKTLRVVLKADVQGSLEAIADALGKLKSDKVELEVIHGAVGSITENDVLLASASGAIIIGFRVKLESGVSDAAKNEGVRIKLYTIIYELIEQVEESMEGMLEPESKESVVGHAEVRKIFELSKGPPVAGCVVTDGRIARSARVRLLRRKAVQYEGRIASLKHFQDDVREVKAGSECGLRLENFPGVQEGDVLECYTVEKVAASL
ncbi:MAG TPA: translation initiation factor IF-2 [Verrucomicrobiae bacterium]|nr:translation initiation factor IF-2 [Verrucomicrobiae bacterium]